jgi:hypothetical protein
MTLLESCLLFITAAALLWTKALDVISTWRFIGVHGESNPIARWLFEKTGLVGGMGMVCALYIVILGLQIAAVVWINDSWTTYSTVALGAFIAFIQYDVARFLIGSDAFAKVRQLACVARQAPLQLPLPAEILRVGVFAPKHDDLLVAEVPQTLEHQQSHQSPDRQGGPPFRAVKWPELFFKHAPVHRPSQTEKCIARIELAFQIGQQKGDLGFVGGAGLHGRGLLGFCGYGQVLPAIQHSKNCA